MSLLSLFLSFLINPSGVFLRSAKWREIHNGFFVFSRTNMICMEGNIFAGFLEQQRIYKLTRMNRLLIEYVGVGLHLLWCIHQSPVTVKSSLCQFTARDTGPKRHFVATDLSAWIQKIDFAHITLDSLISKPTPVDLQLRSYSTSGMSGKNYMVYS